MAGSASPATVLHDVVIRNEQTGAEWRPGRAAIDRGCIVVAATPKHLPPDAFFDRNASTFTITATDGGERQRRFDGLTFDRVASSLPKRIVFT